MLKSSLDSFETLEELEDRLAWESLRMTPPLQTLPDIWTGWTRCNTIGPGWLRWVAESLAGASFRRGFSPEASSELFAYVERAYALFYPGYIRERDRAGMARAFSKALASAQGYFNLLNQLAESKPSYSGFHALLSRARRFEFPVSFNSPGALLARELIAYAERTAQAALAEVWAGGTPGFTAASEPLAWIPPSSRGPELFCPFCDGPLAAGHWGRGGLSACFARAYALPEEAELEALAWGVVSIPQAAVLSERPLILNRAILIGTGLPLSTGLPLKGVR